MEKSHRNILIVLLALLAVVFAFNRWAFRETGPFEISLFLAPVSANEQAANEVFTLLEIEWQDYYAPLLVETAYSPFATTNRRDRIIRILDAGTGQNFGNDHVKWQRWLWNAPENLHDDYAEFKALLYEQIDPSFREYFHKQRAKTIRLDEVVWSGIPRDGVPPITQPKHLENPAPDFLPDEELVIGLELNGKPRAYPRRMLEYHELVQDSLGGDPIVGTLCGFSGCAAFYNASVNNVAYEFGNSGFHYRANKLLYDKSTKSLWQALSGLPVIGPMAGGATILQPLPVVTTTWKTWRELHPNTSLLSPDTGFQIDYSKPTPFSEYAQTDELVYQVPKTDDRLKNKQEVLAVRAMPADARQLAIARELLLANRVYHGESGGNPYVVLTDESGASRVYESGEVKFESFDGRSATDSAGKAWKLTETALTGPDNAKLRRYPAHRAYWFAWQAAYPDTDLVK